MKFNLRYNPHKNKILPKIKKNQQIRSIKTKKYVQKTEIYNKNTKTIVEFAMARIGHHSSLYFNIDTQKMTCCYGQPNVNEDVHENNEHSYLYYTSYNENGKLHTID